MGTTLLATVHLAFSLLLLAAALAWGATRPPVARRIAVALALAPLLAFHGLLLWKTAFLRFDVGVLHSPWRLATALLLLHLVGAALLLARARREPGAGAWPAGTLALAALFALALDATTLWNLELAARLRLGDLRVEAGRIAWRESPPRPEDEENAALRYQRAAELLEADEELGRELRVVLGEQAALDLDDPALRAVLLRLAPALEALRAGARLEACWFEPEPQFPGADELVGVPRILPLMQLADALALQARVRAADGDLAGALEDVEGLLALSDHLARTPVLISLMGACRVRDLAVGALAHALVAEEVGPSSLEDLALPVGPVLVAGTARALAMEEAYGLSMVGLLARGDVGLGDGGWRPLSRLDAALYKVFLLEDDVAGYRLSARELQQLARAPLAEVLAAPEPEAREIRGRGLLASLLVTNVRRMVLMAHLSDARVELGRLALEATRYRLEHGAYPTSLDELEVDAPGVELEGDGSWVRFLRPDLSDDDRPLDLRLPPAKE
jgi:hypothetical protein